MPVERVGQLVEVEIHHEQAEAKVVRHRPEAAVLH
jgi:hypothetical protein